MLVKVRKRLETSAIESTVEDRSSAQRQLVWLTKAQIDRLAEEHLSGKTVYELGAQFKILRTTVSRYLKQRGVPMRRQGVDESFRGEIHGQYGISSCEPNITEAQLPRDVIQWSRELPASA